MVLTRAYPNFMLGMGLILPLLNYVHKFGSLISVWVLVHVDVSNARSREGLADRAANIRLL